MYLSQINPTTNFGCAKMLQKKPKLLDRSTLQRCSNLKNLQGSFEKRKAWKWVWGYSAGNATTAAFMAQLPIFDELVLSSVEGIMTAHIMNKIYKFDFSMSIIKSMATALAGHKAGTTAFKYATRFIPLVGNSVNAAIAGSTTLTLGGLIINTAEKLDKLRKAGKPIDIYIIKDLLSINRGIAGNTIDTDIDSSNP